MDIAVKTTWSEMKAAEYQFIVTTFTEVKKCEDVDTFLIYSNHKGGTVWCGKDMSQVNLLTSEQTKESCEQKSISGQKDYTACEYAYGKYICVEGK